MACNNQLNEDRQMDIACLRAVLAYAYPRAIKKTTAIDLLGIKTGKNLDCILDLMPDVWEEESTIGLLETAAEKYDEIIRRKYA